MSWDAYALRHKVATVITMIFCAVRLGYHLTFGPCFTEQMFAGLRDTMENRLTRNVRAIVVPITFWTDKFFARDTDFTITTGI